jgi:hypothetical protein
MTYDKVSFYIRDDFSDKGEYIEQRNIVRGDVYGLRNYILQFMETAENKRKMFGKLYISLPECNNAAFAYT